jgi:large subunit ribosomal protein L15
MALHPGTIKPSRFSKKTKKRVGRGNGSGHGTYSTRGGKGQTARSGVSGTRILGLRRSLMKIPKVRGFHSIEPKKQTVSLASIERKFVDGQVVTPHSLKKNNLIRRDKEGVKIVASGTLTKKLIFRGCLMSKKTVELVEKSGGVIEF